MQECDAEKDGVLRLGLDALEVVRVLLLALPALSARRSARVADPAAATPLLDRAGDGLSGRGGSSDLGRPDERDERGWGRGLGNGCLRGNGCGGGRRSYRRLRRDGRRGRRPAGSIPDRGPGDRVRSGAAVDIEQDACVGRRVRAWDGHAGGQRLCARRGHLDLHALHVELGAAGAVALVQRDDLGTQEVLACG